MPRARNIKPSFFDNEDLAECSFAARLLFIGLWTLADRWGVVEHRPRRFKARLFPLDAVDVEKLLGELSEFGFIHPYKANGTELLYIPTFSRHQNPHRAEKPSSHPLPYIESDSAPCQHSSSTVPAGLIPDSLLLIPDSKDGASAPVVVPTKSGDETIPENKLAEWAKDFPGLDVRRELAECAEYWQAKPKSQRRVSGIRAGRNWLKNAQRFAERDGKPTATVERRDDGPPQSPEEERACFVGMLRKGVEAENDDIVASWAPICRAKWPDDPEVVELLERAEEVA